MMSAVAGVVDRGGGLRVVVGPRDNMHAHVGAGERLFIVPGLKVKEPVASGRSQADLIAKVKGYVNKQLAANACGGCRQCCKTPYINEDGLTKASHTWCDHCDGNGCAIYRKRPKPCVAFECLWLKSQRTAEPMAQELRPDRCGAILSDDTTDNDPNVMEVHVDGVMTPSAIAFIAASPRKAKRITHYYGEK